MFDPVVDPRQFVGFALVRMRCIHVAIELRWFVPSAHQGLLSSESPIIERNDHALKTIDVSIKLMR
ncbi:MAG: hypothetical protein A3I66_24710 [Burkholderiales bacterium RIFCSPLOWO2_02_FULL_57_36]|nr:MAG: hypothetical protein A3I66_24710 [Burkholderiales bacterium RIFCSPLOWO2_02_FULL_57_36]